MLSNPTTVVTKEEKATDEEGEEDKEATEPSLANK